MTQLQVFVAALWWGSLTALGFMVVPLLFIYSESANVAGTMAAHLFEAQTWLSVFCCAVLIFVVRIYSFNVAAGLLLALVLEFFIKPHIVARENMFLWHNLGSGAYFLQWLFAGHTLWRLTSRRIHSA